VSARRAATRLAAGGTLLAGLALGPLDAAALITALSPVDVKDAVAAGARAVDDEDFEAEWQIPLPGGREVVVTTPFSRLALAGRRAAYKGEPLAEKDTREQVDRGKGKLQLLVTLVGDRPDFARRYQPLLRVGSKAVKPSFVQNERTGLKLEDGKFAARSVYVFPLEGLPARGAVILVVHGAVDGPEVFRATIDLGKMR
jgi:hypothetical protein